ncbi:MAG: flagellar hook-basal body complex protein FliE [Bacterioplanes sp.]|nr:flagellar hook-basal body complex protein FliE [Bacterioplanes sp.]
MVNRVDVNSVLMQMRQVKDQIRANQNNAVTAPVNPMQGIGAPRAVAETARVAMPQGDPSIPNFQTMFQNAINTVNSNQKVASDLSTRFEQGDASVDLPEVMIAMQKSSVSFQAMTQVRNKLVEAYKDVMNMPV